jgi:hypothetical protein
MAADVEAGPVIIEEMQPLIGTSRLMMMLGAKDYQLKQWTVTDRRANNTTVAVSNLDSSSALMPGCSGSTIRDTRNSQFAFAMSASLDIKVHPHVLWHA